MTDAPRRVSVIEDDPGYPQYLVAKEHGKSVHITLDGKEVPYCITADEDRGFVLADVLGEDGLPQIDPRNPDSIWQETRHGKVRIEFRDDT